MIDIVMPVYGEPLQTMDTINSFFKETSSFNEKFRLIIINDGSTGTTEEWSPVEKAADVYIKRENKGISATLNELIIKHAKSEWVIIVESDAIAPIGWFNKILERKEEIVKRIPDTKWIGFRITDSEGNMVFYYRDCNEIGETIGLPLGADGSQPYYNILRPVTHVSNVCSIINREAFIGIDGADEKLKKQWIDTDIGMSINKNNWMVIADPSISFIHNRPHVPIEQDVEDYKYFREKWWNNYVREQKRT